MREKDLIAACLNGGTTYALQAIEIVNKDDFQDPRHQAIWSAVERLSQRGGAIDRATVQSELGDALPQAGGVLYFKEIGLHFSNLENVASYARMVKDQAIVLTAERKLGEVITYIRGEDPTPGELREKLDAVYLALHDKSMESWVSNRQAVELLLEDAQRRVDAGGELLGDPLFGIPELDKMIEGASGGDVIIVAGRPKTGKSSLFNTIAVYHAENRIPMSLISGEMPLNSTTARQVARMSNLPYRYIRTGDFLKNKQHKELVEKMKEDMLGNNVYLGKDSLSIPKMNYHVRSMYQKGVQTFLFDRVGRFQEVSHAKAGADHVERGRVVDAMRDLANDLNVKIITANQMKGEADMTAHKRPAAHHVYGGTAPLANCTKAIGIYNPYAKKLSTFLAGPFEGDDSNGFVEVFVLAGNDIEEGSVKLKFIADQMAMVDNDFLADDSQFQFAGVPEKESWEVSDEDLPF